MSDNIGFVGCGNMGQALLRGWLDGGVVSADCIRLSARQTAATTAQAFGVQSGTPQDVVDASDIILLGMKPQHLAGAVEGLKFRAEQCVVSMLAGVTLEVLQRMVAPATVIRTMPNLACAFGSGVTLFQAGAVRGPYVERVEKLFGALGHLEVFDDETLFHAGTGISGSGPAYLFLAAAALAEGGEAAGLRHEVALRLARETIVGAGAVLRGSKRDPDILRKAVTSPGGTTEAALSALSTFSYREALISAVVAAAKRSDELSCG